jgi:hypothetical protein
MSWAVLEIQFHTKLDIAVVLEDMLKTKYLSIKLVKHIRVTEIQSKILKHKI